VRRSQKERQPTRLDISVKVCCILYVTEKVPVQRYRTREYNHVVRAPEFDPDPVRLFPCFIVPPAPPGVIVVFLNRLPMCVPATPVFLNRNNVPASPVTFYRYDESRGARLTNEDGLRPAPRGRNSFAAIASRGSTSARARCKSARITRMRAPRRVAAHPRHGELPRCGARIRWADCCQILCALVSHV